MDKLQWFKFRPSDWTMGRISKMSFATQGEYIRFCCIYWNKECKMTIEDAKLEFKKTTFDNLITNKVLKTEDKHIKINFLDEQMEAINSMREVNSIAGKISAKKRKLLSKNNDRSTTVQRNSTEKIREDKKRVDKVYIQFNHLSLTTNEYNKLIEEWKQEDVLQVIDDIQNYNKNVNYKSLYLTARKWLRKTPKKNEMSSEDSLLDNVKKQMK